MIEILMYNNMLLHLEIFIFLQFTIHSDLGRVVQVIRREFELDQSLTLANGSER